MAPRRSRNGVDVTAPTAASTTTTTIAAVAEEVGVSVATVSKVLNGRADVAAQTRAKVEESLERHSYRRRGKRKPPAPGRSTWSSTSSTRRGRWRSSGAWRR